MTAPFDMDDLLTLTRLALDAHCVSLFMPQQDGHVSLVAASCEGDPTPIVSTIPPGRGLVGWIARNKKPLVVDTFDPEHSLLGYYEEEHEQVIATFMGFPLPHGGALCVDCVNPRSFSQREQRVLNQLANQCDTFISQHANNREADICRYFEHLSLIQDLRHKNLHWHAYLNAFLDIFVRGASFDYAAFASLPENASMYTLEGESTPLLLKDSTLLDLPTTAGIAGWVFRNDGLPVFAEGLDSSQTAPLFGKIASMPAFGAVVCLPVVLNKTTCAVLCLAGEEPRQMDENMRTFVRMATTELTSYLETITLKHRVQQLLPKAVLHRDGALSFDPDSAPSARLKEDD